LERQEHGPVDVLLEKRNVGGVLARQVRRLRRDMPPWLEVLLDVLGFAGFIGVATWAKSPGETTRPDR
jgi:hypothetical protein